MANPPKPTELKKRQGTYRPHRDPARGVRASVPAIGFVDHTLTPGEVLDLVLAEGVPWIASTDYPAVALLRSALDYLAQLQADPRTRPSDVTAQFKAVCSMLSALGLDPSARARLGLAEVKAVSILDQLREAKP